MIKNISLEEQEKALFTELKAKVISLLARREYSAKELKGKLLTAASSKQTGMSNEAIELLIENVLAEMQRLGYQNDARFASMFVRHKSQAGNGPLKISRELCFKGGSRDLFEQVVEEEQIDFFELAAELMQRKYSLDQVRDYQTFQKVFRYFSNRGFTSEQIKYAKETLLEIE